MPPAVTRPTTEDEWTTHALNIHGAIFERWCESVVGKPWEVHARQHPVRFRDHETVLDLWAWTMTQAGFVVSLAIECKKHNPELVDWCFFCSPSKPHGNRYVYVRLDVRGSGAPFDIHPSLAGPLVSEIELVDEGRETRGNYQDYRDGKDKTRTANAAIFDAARQAVLAAHAIAESEHTRFAYVRHSPPWSRHAILPVVVTTARLWACDFDPADVDPATGEIPMDKLRRRPVDRVLFDYPVSAGIQYDPRGQWSYMPDRLAPRHAWRHVAKRQVIIVRAAALDQFLKWLHVQCEFGLELGDKPWIE